MTRELYIVAFRFKIHTTEIMQKKKLVFNCLSASTYNCKCRDPSATDTASACMQHTCFCSTHAQLVSGLQLWKLESSSRREHAAQQSSARARRARSHVASLDCEQVCVSRKDAERVTVEVCGCRVWRKESELQLWQSVVTLEGMQQLGP